MLVADISERVLDKVSISMTINSTASILLAFLIVIAEKQGIKILDTEIIEKEMLERMLRRLALVLFAVEDLSNEDVIRIVRKFKLEKLPSHYLVMLMSVLQIIEMVFKKLSLEKLDWNDLVEDG